MQSLADGLKFDGFTPVKQRDATVEAAGGRVIGQSEAGRPIWGIVLGDGPQKVSLLAGAHSDEPVGSETLRGLIQNHDTDEIGPWLERHTFVVVPHVNPDGEAAQLGWMEDWPDPIAHMTRRERELPGRDVEFGYPAMRKENAAVSAFLAEHGPFELHLSLHGMSIATGGWHLIERSWADRTVALREAYAQSMRKVGLELFDWDRAGDKGFEYLGPGFSTTPRSGAMREHFLAQGDAAMASNFAMNSMEYVQSLGGDPLCMVTELPLWVVDGKGIEDEPGRPYRFDAFRAALDRAKVNLEEDQVDQAMTQIEPFTMTPLPIGDAVRLQLRAIELGLDAVSRQRPVQ